MLKSVWRSWVEVDSTPPLLIPRYAIRGSVALGTIDLRMEFRSCPEFSAVQQGRKFRVQTAEGFVGMFEATPSGRTGRLKSIGAPCTIDADDLEQANFTAYYLAGADPKPQEIAIVQGEPTGSNQMRIQPGGAIEVSPNLTGKTLKLRVHYPRMIVQLPEPIETMTAHLVGEVGDAAIGEIPAGAIVYARVTGCRVLTSTAPRVLHLQFEPENIALRQLLHAKVLDPAVL